MNENEHRELCVARSLHYIEQIEHVMDSLRSGVKSSEIGEMISSAVIVRVILEFIVHRAATEANNAILAVHSKHQHSQLH